MYDLSYIWYADVPLQHNVGMYDTSHVTGSVPPNVPLRQLPQGDRLIHLFYVTTDWLSCSDTLT